MSVVGLSMEGAQGLAQQLQSLAVSVSTLANAQTRNAGATRSVVSASNAAATATTNLTQQAQQGVQRFAGLANAVQSLVGHLGGHDRTAGLVGSIASTTAAFAGMGSSFGPIGTGIGLIVGATAGLVSAFRSAEETTRANVVAEQDLRSEIERNAELYGTYEAAIRSASAARAGEALVEFGLATPEAYAAREQALIDQIRVREAARAEIMRSISAVEAEIATSDEGVGAINRMVDSVDDMREAYNRLGGEAVALDQQLQSLRSTAADAAAEAEAVLGEDLASAGTTHRGGGRRRPAEFRGAAMTEEGLAASTSLVSPGEMSRRATADAARELETFTALAREGREMEERLAESLEAEKERHVAASEAAHEHRRALEELRDEVRDGIADFANGYVNSLDDVVASYRDLQDAAKETGVTLNRSGLLMARGMTAVGNQIAETVGGTMTSAFSSAVGAWLDGSKSFVEAAEEMAKGVIKALVQESIVQGVTELARGIADLASYRYDSAALHFAAAGAWAIVGGVAGGIGAATGAFGGGGKDSGGSSQRDMADADRERQREAAAGPTVVNLYMTGMPMTQADVGAGFARGIRASQRAGYLPAGALTGGR